jgi:Polyketide cyclase / dehydrase and lipid transport
MATNRRELPLDASIDKVWAAVRDFGQVHTKVAPGFLTGLEMDGADRIVTFSNGMVARERLVTLDDEARRLVYCIPELAPAVAGMMDHATPFLKKTLEA